MAVDAGQARDDLISVARGGALNVAGAAAAAVLQFLLVVVISRAAGAGGAGVLYQAISLFTILTAAAQFGADSGVLRTLPWYRSRQREGDIRGMLGIALWPVATLSAVLAAATFALAPFLADVFMRGVPAEEAVRHIQLLTPFIPLAATTMVMLSATRAYGTMIPTVAVEQVGKPALRVILVLLAVGAGLGTVGIIVSWAIPVAVGAAASLQALVVMLRRHPVDAHASARSRGEVAAEFWRFSAPRGLAGILEITLGWLDILLVGAFRPAEEVGVYAAVSRTAVMALFILRAVSLAFAPRISALLATDRRGEAQTVYQVATWWLMAASWPIYLTLAVFSEYLLGIFGPQFEAGATALTILSVAMLFNMATGNTNAVLLMGGKSFWNLANAAVALAINVALNLYLIPRLGIEGAALAWSASILVLNLAAVTEIRLLLGLKPFGPGYPVVVLASGICFGALGLVIRAWLGGSLVGFIVFALVSTASYVAVLYAVRERIHLPALRQALALRSWRGGPRPA